MMGLHFSTLNDWKRCSLVGYTFPVVDNGMRREIGKTVVRLIFVVEIDAVLSAL